MRVAPAPLHRVEDALWQDLDRDSTRRAFHAALKELERLETRDRDAVVVTSGPVSPATHSQETQLQVLGSLRKKDPDASLATRNDRVAGPAKRGFHRRTLGVRRNANLPWAYNPHCRICGPHLFFAGLR